MKWLPFCKVFKCWSPFRMEVRTLASFVALAGLLAVGFDEDIGRVGVLLEDLMRRLG